MKWEPDHLKSPYKLIMNLWNKVLQYTLLKWWLFNYIESRSHSPNIDDIEADAYDELLTTEPLLQHNGELVRATITARKRDAHGNLIGNYNPNPLLNTRDAKYQTMDDEGYDE
jgi:hypothetical protein